MNYTNTIIELLLFALCLSLWINSLHLAFGEGMILNWLYEWLESKFRSQISFSQQFTEDSDINGKFKRYESVSIGFGYNYYKKVYNNGIVLIYDSKDNIYNTKYRNSEGLLYIAKPIYACVTCMPSLWSLPLLTILVWWKVFFICIFASVLSTLIRDQLYND